MALRTTLHAGSQTRQPLSSRLSRCPIAMSPVNIHTSSDCCGCGACGAACPTACITMQRDSEGFLVPNVDKAQCIQCGRCSDVCPWRNQTDISERISPPAVYAAWHLDEHIRHQSSSGGVFTALAQAVLAREGDVVGAAFDADMVCQHILVEHPTGMASLRGSKYVQSTITSELFHRIRTRLIEGRYLLFTGTPCQVAALRNYLSRDYERLLCCDLICHGVPSPGWFQTYIDQLCRGTQPITSFTFRDKTAGWKRFRIRKTWSDDNFLLDGMYHDPFMAAFLKNFSLRESCYTCRFATIPRQGDLTIGDYWGVRAKYPEYDCDDKGTSLILVNSGKGQTWLNYCSECLFTAKSELPHAIATNRMLTRAASRPPQRATFFNDASFMTISDLRDKYQLHPPFLWQRALAFTSRVLKRLKPW